MGKHHGIILPDEYMRISPKGSKRLRKLLILGFFTCILTGSIYMNWVLGDTVLIRGSQHFAIASAYIRYPSDIIIVFSLQYDITVQSRFIGNLSVGASRFSMDIEFTESEYQYTYTPDNLLTMFSNGTLQMTVVGTLYKRSISHSFYASSENINLVQDFTFSPNYVSKYYTHAVLQGKYKIVTSAQFDLPIYGYTGNVRLYGSMVLDIDTGETGLWNITAGYHTMDTFNVTMPFSSTTIFTNSPYIYATMATLPPDLYGVILEYRLYAYNSSIGNAPDPVILFQNMRLELTDTWTMILPNGSVLVRIVDG